MNWALRPQSIPRLAKIASAYQRIKYVGVAFKVQTQVGTMTSGGYVTGFVRDVADTSLGSDPLARLVAEQNSQTHKWWESTTIRAHLPKTLLYTSEASQGSGRWESPGRFYIVCDGPPTQGGSISVDIMWEVQLSEPTLEEQISDGDLVSLIVREPIDFEGSQLDAGVLTFTNEKNLGYHYAVESGGFNESHDFAGPQSPLQFPNEAVGVMKGGENLFYKLPWPLTVSAGLTSDWTDHVMRYMVARWMTTEGGWIACNLLQSEPQSGSHWEDYGYEFQQPVLQPGDELRAYQVTAKTMVGFRKDSQYLMMQKRAGILPHSTRTYSSLSKTAWPQSSRPLRMPTIYEEDLSSTMTVSGKSMGPQLSLLSKVSSNEQVATKSNSGSTHVTQYYLAVSRPEATEYLEGLISLKRDISISEWLEAMELHDSVCAGGNCDVRGCKFCSPVTEVDLR